MNVKCSYSYIKPLISNPKSQFYFKLIARQISNPPQNEKGNDHHLDNQSLLAEIVFISEIHL